MKPDFSPASSQKLLNIIYGYELACCTYVAATLNIAELLFASPKSVEELAQATHTNADALYRVLRVVAAEGFFKEEDYRVFSYTPQAAALHGATIGSIKYFVQAILGEHYHAFGNLLHSVRTGETAFDHYYNMDVWEFYGSHPDIATNFNKAMAGLTQYYAAKLVPAYDFNQFRTIVDIGGGNGSLLFAVLNAAADAKGVIFDAPVVIPQAEQLIQENNLQNRCSAVAGNFFEAVPPGMDAYLLKFILHDWNDADCIKILQNCSSAMQPGAKVLIMDAVIPSAPANDYHGGKYTDVIMLAATKGRERSEADFRSIVEAAGLQFNTIIDAGLDEVSIVEAEKKD